MKRNFFLVSFLAAIVFGFNGAASAQQTKATPAPAANAQDECAKIKQLTPEQIGKFNAEQKKVYEEAVNVCKKNAEISAKNAKVQNEDKLIAQAVKEGNDAFNSKNYDLAIAKYDEGYRVNETYIGSAPVFLNNKAVALKVRGTERLRTGMANKDNAMKEQAKKDFIASYEAASKALQMTKNPPADASQSDLKEIPKNKYDALVRMTDALYLLAFYKLDPTKNKEIVTTYQEYLATETDAAKKAKAHSMMADALRESGDCEAAAAEYKQILTNKADDPDALAGAGLCLFSNGVASGSKETMQEGMNIMTRFVEVAPENHKLKESVKTSIEYLKTEQKLAPQKTGRSVGPAKKRG